MPRGYRLLIVAVGIVLCGAKPPSEQAQRSQGAQQAEPAPPFTAYAGYNLDPCYRAKNHDAADLCAQWRASIAAEKAAHEARRATNWSIIATFLNALALFAVWLSLRQTKRSVMVNREANTIAISALRPWLSIKEIKVRTFAYPAPIPGEIPAPGGARFQVNHQIEITVENTGSKPALDVWCFTDILDEMYPESIPEKWFEMCRNGKHHVSRNIAPNSTEVIEGTAYFHATIREGARVAALGVSLIYNAAKQCPPHETSRLYAVGRIATADSMTSYSIQELIDAGAADPVYGSRALPCAVAPRFNGRMT